MEASYNINQLKVNECNQLIKKVDKAIESDLKECKIIGDFYGKINELYSDSREIHAQVL